METFEILTNNLTAPLSGAWTQQFFVLTAAAMAGLTLAAVASRMSLALAPSNKRALADYIGPGDAGQSDQAVTLTDRETVILLSLGLRPRRGLLNYIRAAAGIVPALLLLLLGLPAVAALGGGALCLILANSFLMGRWRRLRVQVEQELPTFVSRLAGTLLVTASPLKAMSEVAGTLNEDSPLHAWLQRVLSGARMEGQAFFAQARGEATLISPSLALVIFEVGRFFETGGAGFAKAFTTTAEELSAILEARAVAGAKAESARGAVHMMLAIMGGILILMLSSPNIRQGFNDPLVQLISAAALAAMGCGYMLLNGMIDEALEA